MSEQTIVPMNLVRWSNAPRGKIETFEIDGATLRRDRIQQRKPCAWRYEPRLGDGRPSRGCMPGVAAIDFTVAAAMLAIQDMMDKEDRQ